MAHKSFWQNEEQRGSVQIRKGEYRVNEQENEVPQVS